MTTRHTLDRSVDLREGRSGFIPCPHLPRLACAPSCKTSRRTTVDNRSHVVGMARLLSGNGLGGRQPARIGYTGPGVSSRQPDPLRPLSGDGTGGGNFHDEGQAAKGAVLKYPLSDGCARFRVSAVPAQVSCHARVAPGHRALTLDARGAETRRRLSALRCGASITLKETK